MDDCGSQFNLKFPLAVLNHENDAAFERHRKMRPAVVASGAPLRRDALQRHCGLAGGIVGDTGRCTHRWRPVPLPLLQPFH